MMWLNLFDPLEFKVSNILLSTSEFYECDHLTMCDEIKTFSTGLTNLRCLLFQVWGHWPRCLGNKMTIFILVQSKTLWLWLVVWVCVCQPVRIRSIHLATTFASSILKHMGGLNFTTLSQGPSVLTQIRSSSFSLRPSSKIIIEGGISFRTVDIVFWNSVMVFLFYLFTTSAAVFVAGVFCSRSCTSSRPTNRPTPLWRW